MTRSNTVDPEDLRGLLDIAGVTRVTGWGKTKVFDLIHSDDPDFHLPSFKLGKGRTCKRYVRETDLLDLIARMAALDERFIRPGRGRRPAIPRASAQRQSRRTSAA